MISNAECVCVCVFLLYDYNKNSGMLIGAAISAAKRHADMTIKVSDHESNYQGKRRNIHHTSKPLSIRSCYPLNSMRKLCFGGLLKECHFWCVKKEGEIFLVDAQVAYLNTVLLLTIFQPSLSVQDVVHQP